MLPKDIFFMSSDGRLAVIQAPPSKGNLPMVGFAFWELLIRH
jgi:hypothetical protein